MGIRADSIIKFKHTTYSKKILIYKVQVSFSKETIEVNNDKINIGIKLKPIKGQANKEIIKKLAKYFKTTTKNIQIKSGHKAQQKIIEIL